MKINVIPSLVALAAAVLLAFLFYTMSSAEEQMLNALAYSGFISVGICLECGIGISLTDAHHSVNGFAVSMFFLFLFVVEHCCFATWGMGRTWLIITTGLLLVLFFLIYYAITKAKM